jgi:EPS-associated MarR family transcriptional regulator
MPVQLVNTSLNDSAAAAPENDSQSELELLRLLAKTPEVSQRSIAAGLGLSLGKAHYVLQALLAKGWVKAQNFRRSGNKLAYAYVLTPSGIAHRIRLTRVFLAAKQRDFEQLEDEIVLLRKELDEQDDGMLAGR